MSRVRVLPGQVHGPRQRLSGSFRVSDSRGYLVRGALVDVRSMPAGRIQLGSGRSTTDGTVSVSLRTTPRLSLRRGVLNLLFSSFVPGQPRTASTATRALVRIPVNPVR
jgi:hypothetical protein